MIAGSVTVLFLSPERRFMETAEEKYSEGGTFETTIGKTKYEVVLNFKEEGMSMQEKALRVVKEGDSKDGEGA